MREIESRDVEPRWTTPKTRGKTCRDAKRKCWLVPHRQPELYCREADTKQLELYDTHQPVHILPIFPRGIIECVVSLSDMLLLLGSMVEYQTPGT